MAIWRTTHSPIQHWPPGLLHSFLFLPCLGPAEFGYLLPHSYMCRLPSHENCFPWGHLGSNNWIPPEEIPCRVLCLSERNLGSLGAAVWQVCLVASWCQQVPRFFASFCASSLSAVIWWFQDGCCSHMTEPKAEERVKASLCLSLFFMSEETLRSSPKDVSDLIGHMATRKGSWVVNIWH